MALELRGINFGNVFNTAGARNFFGASQIGGDWRQHKLFNLIPCYGWDGATFISKTTTLAERPGNMALRKVKARRYSKHRRAFFIFVIPAKAGIQKKYSSNAKLFLDSLPVRQAGRLHGNDGFTNFSIISHAFFYKFPKYF